jgi:hypothetical protein
MAPGRLFGAASFSFCFGYVFGNFAQRYRLEDEFAVDGVRYSRNIRFDDILAA